MESLLQFLFLISYYSNKCIGICKLIFFLKKNNQLCFNYFHLLKSLYNTSDLNLNHVLVTFYWFRRPIAVLSHSSLSPNECFLLCSQFLFFIFVISLQGQFGFLWVCNGALKNLILTSLHSFPLVNFIWLAFDWEGKVFDAQYSENDLWILETPKCWINLSSKPSTIMMLHYVVLKNNNLK